MTRLIRVLPAVLLAAAATLAVAQDPQSKPAQPVDASQPAEATQPSAKGMKPNIKLETSLGDIVLELDAEKAPVTVNNFIKYAEDGHYNNTVFHRVISNFMIQGGGFTPDMDEKKNDLRPSILNEWTNGLKNVRGTIAMARVGGNPHSATAQFFINVVDNPRLDQPQQDGAGYCVFGKVIVGMDVVDKIRDTKVISHPKYPSPQPVTPETPVVVKSVKVIGEFDRTRTAELARAADAVRTAAAEAKAAQDAKDLAAAIELIEEEAGKKLTQAPSGLSYVILKEGAGASPAMKDKVEFHVVGSLPGGKVWQDSRQRGQAIVVEVERLEQFKGLQDSILAMKPGERRKVVCPPATAFGENGGGPIPPSATVLLDLELIKVTTEADVKAELQKKVDQLIARVETETKQKPTATATGLMYVVVAEGTGATPKPENTVKVHYTGWLADGTKFDSSRDGDPAEFPLNRVIPGWTEGVGMMKVGEKRMLIIPPELGYGERGFPPTIPAQSPLLFEVELLEIK